MLSFALLSLAELASASSIISSSTFTECGKNTTSAISVKTFSFDFDHDTSTIRFAVGGFSWSELNVKAVIKVSAYGISALSKTLDPCDYDVNQLCPLKSGAFDASGTVVLPADIVAQIPEAAFLVPDLEGDVTLELVEKSTERNTLCLQAPIGNGVTAKSPIASYSTAAIAAGAVAVSIVASVAAGAGAVPVGVSPSALDVLQYFQAIATNGMLSVAYPAVIRSYYQNYAWSTGLIPLVDVQRSIDNFRGRTGGDLARSSVETLRASTLLFDSDGRGTEGGLNTRRMRRQVNDAPATVTTDHTKITRLVSGIQAYVEELRIPSENTFMTLFILFLALIAGLIALSLLTRGILELWSRSERFPRRLRKLRDNYWSLTVGLLVRTILIIYGTWALFCLYQFKNGDSWAATFLAALSLAVFSGVILFFTVQITRIARHGRHAEELYQHKPHLRRYGLFYDQFKSQFWWFFIPCILYSLLKSVFVVFGQGHGLVQVVGCLALEVLFLAGLFATRAYDGRKANVVNSMIGVVRILTLVGTLIFVDVLDFKATTKTVAGVVLIVLQTLLTVVLALLIVLNAILSMTRKKKSEKDEEAVPLEPVARRDLKRISAEETSLAESIYSYRGKRLSVDSQASEDRGLVSRSESVDITRDHVLPIQPTGSRNTSGSHASAEQWKQPPDYQLVRPSTSDSQHSDAPRSAGGGGGGGGIDREERQDRSLLRNSPPQTSAGPSDAAKRAKMSPANLARKTAKRVGALRPLPALFKDRGRAHGNRASIDFTPPQGERF